MHKRKKSKLKCVCGHPVHRGECTKKKNLELLFENANIEGQIQLPCECDEYAIDAALARANTFEHKRRKFCDLPFGCNTHHQITNDLRFFNPDYKGKRK